MTEPHSEIELLPPRHSSVLEHHVEQPDWSLDQLISSWLGGMTNSEHTANAYRRDMRQYLNWCTTHNLNALTARMPEAKMYRHHLATEQGLSPRTVARKLSTVSSFYKHLVEAGMREANPLREMSRPRWDRQHSPTQSLTEQEARALLAASRTLRQRVLDPQCLQVALSLMVDLGARITEVCNIDLDDLGTRRGMRIVTLHAKGGKIRERPITAQIGPMIDDWRVRRPDTDTPALLVDARGNRITRRQIADLLPRLARHAGLDNPDAVTPHSCRHAFNEIAKQRGAPLEDRQKAMGHSSPAVTQLYDQLGADLATDPAHLVSAATYTPLEEEEHADG